MTRTWTTIPDAWQAAAPPSEAVPPRERLSPIAVFVGLFILGSVTVAPLAGWNYIVKGMGVVLVIAYGLYAFRTRQRVGGEVWLYLAWAVWAGLGVLFAEYTKLWWTRWQTLPQIWMLLLVISGFTANRRTLSFNLAMFILGALIVGFSSVASGEYQRAVQEGVAQTAGLALNSNEFAYIMLLCTAAVAYFWMRPRRGAAFRLLVLAPVLAACAVGVVLSGSRKGALGLAFFYAAWVWFCYRRELGTRPKVLLVVLLATGIGGYGLMTFASRTGLGERLGRTWTALTTGEDVSGSGSERLELYRVGLEVIADHPFAGVGLVHYRVHSGGAGAHSEYLSIAAETGLIGAALYLPWYLVLYRRARKMRKYADDEHDWRTAGLICAVLVTQVLINFGRTVMYNKFAWIFYGALIGYTVVTWRRLRERAAAGYPAWRPGQAGPAEA